MNANEKAPTNAAHDLQKQRIMAHAVQAFARIGYASASMAELARACEVSKATLYHYFDSKDAILFAAADAYVRRLNEVVTTALAVTEQSQPPDHQAQAKLAVRRLIKALCADYAEHRADQMSLLFDVNHLPAAQHTLIKRQEREIVERIASALQMAYPARFSERQHKVATMSLLGMVNFSFAWFRPHGEIGHAEFADMIIDLWERALQTA